MDEFWRILDERLELCHKALLWRHKHLLGTKSDAAPILWQYGALARLNKGETIDALLKDGYSTISLGYAGIYECVMAMLGVSHTTPEGKQFAIEILKHLNTKCDEWNTENNIGFSVYGTPQTILGGACTVMYNVKIYLTAKRVCSKQISSNAMIMSAHCCANRGTSLTNEQSCAKFN